MPPDDRGLPENESFYPQFWAVIHLWIVLKKLETISGCFTCGISESADSAGIEVTGRFAHRAPFIPGTRGTVSGRGKWQLLSH
jgi:hypothetical protein